MPRPRLLDKLNAGLRGRLTLLSAPAGFGKTTLLSAWIADLGRATAWLSLDAEDSDPSRFLIYLVAAVRTVAANLGTEFLGALQSPQPPPIESLLTPLLNEISAVPDDIVVVLDDYHVIDATSIDRALTFLIEHLPPRVHLVIATREDPQLPLARLRARGHLIELRAADLRFTTAEATDFLNAAMGLNLSTADIDALEGRTEGWIAGLQLAAISMQGQQDIAGFIDSFTGSHRFVLDYLVEEVLHRQSANVQAFLLHTAILDRLCGPLCDAVLRDPGTPGQDTLEYLERANLFLVPLDNERRWYRYHHLFADLLRQQLHRAAASRAGTGEDRIAALHTRASQWYEDNDLATESFHHAAAAGDINRAERLIDGNNIPLHQRGVVTTIVRWLESLPREVLDARPSLWWRHGSLLLVIGQTAGVAEKLQAAEEALAGTGSDEKTRELIAKIAGARAVLALTRHQPEIMLAESRRALEYASPGDLSRRATAHWTLGRAHFLRGERAEADRALTEAVSLSQTAGDAFTAILAMGALAQVQEADNLLHLAAASYRRVLELAGDQPLQIVGMAHIGLARVLCEWDELDAAEQHGQQGLPLVRQYDRSIDRFIVGEVVLARLRLARGDVAEASSILARASQAAHERKFSHFLPDVAAARVATLLRQGDLTAAAQLTQAHDLPLSQARVALAQGDPHAALAVLEPLRQRAEARGWSDERLQALVLQALAHHARGDTDTAMQVLDDALSSAEPGGFIRTFLDEGVPMARLLSAAADRGLRPGYVARLLAAFEAELPQWGGRSASPPIPTIQHLAEPLSERELEVLRLIAQGLSNRDIGERLYLALDTVKGHNRRIFGKLNVQRRTEAIICAREMGLV